MSYVRAVPALLAAVLLTSAAPTSAVLIDGAGDTGSLTGTVGGTARLFGVAGGVLQGVGNSKTFLTVDVTGPGGPEQGYNTTGAVEFETTASGTTSLLLSEIPQVKIGGVNYFEFAFVANQTGGSSLVSLNEITIMQASQGNLTGYNAAGPSVGGATTVVFDWTSNGEFLTVDDFVPGVSDVEMLMYIPAASFSASPFVILYMNAGDPEVANAGAEKWLVAPKEAGCVVLQFCEPIPPQGIPAPGSLALLGLALAVAGWRLRRK